VRIAFSKASFIGSKSDLKSVLETLKSLACFEMTKYEKFVSTDNEKYNELLAVKKRIENAIDISGILLEGREQVEYSELEKFAEYKDQALTVVAAIEELQLQINQSITKIQKNNDALRGLKDYINLPVAFSKVQSSVYTEIFCGIMPTVKYHKFLRDFSHTDMNILAYPCGKVNQIVVVTTHKADSAVANVIHSYDFVPCSFSYDKTAAEMIEVLKKENETLNETIAQLREKIKPVPDDMRALKSYYDFICNEADTLSLIADTVQTQRYYVLNGWVTMESQNLIEERLKQIAPDIICKFEKPKEDDKVPVLLKNSKIIAPFKNITEMYGSPGSRDIDPNPFVAVFYFVFFGMMIGDIGYALVLGICVAAFIYFKKPSHGTKQFLLLFGICSISALAWGFIFGSFFGFKIATQVIDPLQGAIKVMLLSLFMGLVQLLAGVAIDTYIKFRDGKYFKAALKGFPRIILFIGLILFLPSPALKMFGLSAVEFFNTINPIGMWIAICGAIMTALSNPYQLISFFNDTVSYVRLFALSLVGAVIANVGNIIGGMMFAIPYAGYPIGVLVAILFHAFNLGLGLMGAYIHGARLQFVEFFSKFYAGDGEKFRPVGGDLKYTIIKGGK
jgi:V/A-type H+-transporting ATPase subunit I